MSTMLERYKGQGKDDFEGEDESQEKGNIESILQECLEINLSETFKLIKETKTERRIGNEQESGIKIEIKAEVKYDKSEENRKNLSFLVYEFNKQVIKDIMINPIMALLTDFASENSLSLKSEFNNPYLKLQSTGSIFYTLGRERDKINGEPVNRLGEKGCIDKWLSVEVMMTPKYKKDMRRNQNDGIEKVLVGVDIYLYITPHKKNKEIEELSREVRELVYKKLGTYKVSTFLGVEEFKKYCIQHEQQHF